MSDCLQSPKKSTHDSLNQRSTRFVEAVFQKLVCVSAFPHATEEENEQLKLNTLRIALGAIVFYRTLMNAYASYFYYEPIHVLGLSLKIEFLACILVLLPLGCFTVGFFTPLMTLSILLSYTSLDYLLQTRTLGTNVFTLTLLLMFFCNAGSKLSIDSLLLANGSPQLKRILEKLYGVVGFPSSKQVTVYYFGGLITYALTNLGALTFHLHDRLWLSGNTIRLVLTNSFWTSCYGLFKWLDQLAPNFLQAFSVLSVILQSAYQLLMIPLMFSRIGLGFVVVWGGLFFIVSATCLQLSYLPYIEFTLWALLFAPARWFSSAGKTMSKTPLLNEFPLAQQSNIMTAGVVVLATIMGALYILRFNGVERIPVLALAKEKTANIYPWMYHLGYWVPDVLNEGDLAVANLWVRITRLSKNSSPDELQLDGDDGRRLGLYAYDVLYFGNHLLWRRAMASLTDDQLIELFQQPSSFKDSLLKIAMFDYRICRKTLHPYEYHFEIISKNSATGMPTEDNAHVIHQFTYRVPGEKAPTALTASSDQHSSLEKVK
jgi:hypothetical protein